MYEYRVRLVLIDGTIIEEHIYDAMNEADAILIAKEHVGDPEEIVKAYAQML